MVGGDGQGHCSAGRGIFQGVVQNIVKGFRRPLGVKAGRALPGQDSEGNATLSGGGQPLRGRPIQQGLDGVRCWGQSEDAVVQPGGLD